MVFAAFAYLAGTCALLLLPQLPELPVVLAVCAIGTAAALALRTPPLFCLALGFASCWAGSTAALAGRLDPYLEGRTLVVRGTVASVPQWRADAVRFRLATDGADGLPPLVELTWYEPEWIPRAGERLALQVRLRRPRGFANPGGADQEARLLRDRVGATGYVRSATSEGRTWRELARSPVLVAREAVYDAIRSVLGNRPATGIVAGLAVGLQDALSREQWRTLARSGTSHLMAISGMHIGMVAAIVAWLAGRLQRARQRRGATGCARSVAVAAGTIAAVAYSALAGWSVPTRRTALMIVIVAGALWTRRRSAPLDVLALCALAVLVLDPLAPLAAGFWLSFGAVALILFAGTGHLGYQGPVATFGAAQLAVTIGLVPVLAASFGSVSLVSAAVNAVAIPLYTIVIVPAVLIATAGVLVLPEVGSHALLAVAWLIETTWPLFEVPARWSHAAWGIADLPPVASGSMLVGVLAAVAPLPAPGRIAGLALAAAIVAWRPAPLTEGACRVTLLDVGQGLAAVVETRRRVLVYDAGPSFRGGTDTGIIVVEPYLRSRGVRQVDALVASHDDIDHAGGAESLSRLLPVRKYIGSGSALGVLGPVEPCRSGGEWTWDGVAFEWLHPADPLPMRDNDRSCVLLIRAGEHRLLLTGDVEQSAEQDILGRGTLARVDVLVVPHHGSRTSSGAEFVSATRPRWALVSAGYRNRWGFPAPAVRDRWEDAGATVLDTASSGAISFELRAGQPVPSPVEWRRERRRFWHDP
jgi:competence protein ComEC